MFDAEVANSSGAPRVKNLKVQCRVSCVACCTNLVDRVESCTLYK
jgi:hypothetical protein